MRPLKKSELIMICAVGIVCFYWLNGKFLSPTIRKLNNLEIDIQLTKDRLDGAQNILERKGEINSKYESLDVKKPLAEDPSESAVFSKVSRAAAKADILLKKRETGKIEQVGLYSQRDIDVTFEGTFESLIRFLYEICSAEQFMLIQKIDVEHKRSQKGFVEGNCTLTEFISTLENES